MVCVDESLLVLLVAVPIGSVVFPRGRAVYVFGTSVMVLVVALLSCSTAAFLRVSH